jgi:hypothetical protein
MMSRHDRVRASVLAVLVVLGVAGWAAAQQPWQEAYTMAFYHVIVSLGTSATLLGRCNFSLDLYV